MMTASAEVLLNTRLRTALLARWRLTEVQKQERAAVIAFMNEALHQGWSFARIGNALAVTDTAARRYYNRNKRKV